MHKAPAFAVNLEGRLRHRQSDQTPPIPASPSLLAGMSQMDDCFGHNLLSHATQARCADARMDDWEAF